MENEKSNQCIGCHETFSEHSILLSHLRKYKRCRASYGEDEYKNLASKQDKGHENSKKIKDEAIEKQVIYLFIYKDLEFLITAEEFQISLHFLKVSLKSKMIFQLTRLSVYTSVCLSVHMSVRNL